jgi:hypothetical protein
MAPGAEHLPSGSTTGAERREKGRGKAASAQHLGRFGGPTNPRQRPHGDENRRLSDGDSCRATALGFDGVPPWRDGEGRAAGAGRSPEAVRPNQSPWGRQRNSRRSGGFFIGALRKAQSSNPGGVCEAKRNGPRLRGSREAGRGCRANPRRIPTGMRTLGFDGVPPWRDGEGTREARVRSTCAGLEAQPIPVGTPTKLPPIRRLFHWRSPLGGEFEPRRGLTEGAKRPEKGAAEPRVRSTGAGLEAPPIPVGTPGDEKRRQRRRQVRSTCPWVLRRWAEQPEKGRGPLFAPPARYHDPRPDPLVRHERPSMSDRLSHCSCSQLSALNSQLGPITRAWRDRRPWRCARADRW